MKKYIITIDDDLSSLYESIADIAGRTVEEVLTDTLYKTAEIMMRGIVDAAPEHKA